MADLPDGIHDLTDEDWAAFRDAAADGVGHIDGDRSWSPGQVRAYLDAAAALWAGLTDTARMILRASPGLGMEQPELTEPELVAEDDSGYAFWTPLGRAVARAGERVLREDGGQ